MNKLSTLLLVVTCGAFVNSAGATWRNMPNWKNIDCVRCAESMTSRCITAEHCMAEFPSWTLKRADPENPQPWDCVPVPERWETQVGNPCNSRGFLEGKMMAREERQKKKRKKMMKKAREERQKNKRRLMMDLDDLTIMSAGEDTFGEPNPSIPRSEYERDGRVSKRCASVRCTADTCRFGRVFKSPRDCCGRCKLPPKDHPAWRKFQHRNKCKKIRCTQDTCRYGRVYKNRNDCCGSCRPSPRPLDNCMNVQCLAIACSPGWIKRKRNMNDCCGYCSPVFPTRTVTTMPFYDYFKDGHRRYGKLVDKFTVPTQGV